MLVFFYVVTYALMRSVLFAVGLLYNVRVLKVYLVFIPQADTLGFRRECVQCLI